MSDFMTRKEAAAYARCTTRTIDRWIRDREVPIQRYGNARIVLVRRDELDAWLTGDGSQAA